jgi:hypothetical protein
MMIALFMPAFCAIDDSSGFIDIGVRIELELLSLYAFAATHIPIRLSPGDEGRSERRFVGGAGSDLSVMPTPAVPEHTCRRDYGTRPCSLFVEFRGRNHARNCPSLENVS